LFQEFKKIFESMVSRQKNTQKLRWRPKTTQKNTKRVKTIVTLAITAALMALNAPRIFAHGNHASEEHREHSEVRSAPATAAGIMQQIDRCHVELVGAIEQRRLSDVHKHAFAIRDLANSLPGQVAPNRKSAAEAAARKIDKLAAELDNSADAGDQAATAKRYKKFAVAVQKLAARMR
jgi:hypothetical protein